MKRILLLTALLAATLPYAYAYDFSAVAPSGQTLYYNIIDGHAEVVRPGIGSTFNNYVVGDLIIPDSVTYDNITYAVTALATINYNGSFKDCSGLTSVTIPSSVLIIGGWAFKGCVGLTTITIPTSVNSIGNCAFENCSGLTSVVFNADSCTSAGSANEFRAFAGCVNINNFTFGSNVKVIPSFLCSELSNITSVDIPHSVLSIGEGAFKNCSGIASVVFNADSCLSAGWYINPAFSGCTSITSFTLGENVRVIPNCLCTGLSCLSAISIPDSVNIIGEWAFQGCSGLNSLIIPNSVITIGSNAFRNCSGLTSIIIPNSVTNIGNAAFRDCNGLTSLSISNSIDTIREETFQGCGALISISIPNSVIFIGSNAFSYCVGLTSVTIPNSVTTIDGGVFSYCSSLTSLTIPNSITSISSHAFSYSGLTSFTIPNSVTNIGFAAFSGCTSLNSIYIPDSVTRIEAYAFSNCTSLTTIIIPNSVTIIEYYAFRDCSGLLNFISKAVYPIACGNGVFDGIPPYCTLTVPCGSQIYYNVTAPWNTAFPIMNEDCRDEYTVNVTCNDSSMGIALVNGAATATVVEGDEVTLTTISNHGYHFVQWNDGDTNNPRTITLTQDTSFTAIFATNQYMVSGISVDSIKGSVLGISIVDYLDTVTLMAIANYGYHFVSWDDNSTDNPLLIVADSDVTRIAFFDFNQYSTTVHPDSTIHGFCNGGGNYNYLSERNIQSIANHGYHFTHWQDGDTNNPRTFILTQDTSFTAYYDKNTYTLTFQSADTNMGIVNTISVTGEYLDTTMQIYATAKPHYHFDSWDDSWYHYTENPRSFVFDNNRTYTASFSIDVHNISVQVDDIAHGTVEGSGSREYGQPITVSATPYSGYQFAHWSDGSTYNPYTFAVLEDKDLTAVFIADGELWQDTVVVYDTTYIDVPVHDTTYIDVPVHDTIYINVPVHDTTYIDVPVHDTTYINVPVHDTTYITVTDTLMVTQYDTVTNTVYDTVDNYVYDTVTVTDTLWLTQIDTVWLHDTIIVHDTVYITSEGIGDVDAMTAKVYASNGQIVVEGANGNMVTFYDVHGRVLATKRDEFAPLRFDAPASGTYLIKIGNYPARRVVVIR